LFLKEGAAEIAAWGGGEFELLIEIVNPVSSGALEFQVPWGKSDRRAGLPKSRPEAR
jgi:hypothetical protein